MQLPCSAAYQMKQKNVLVVSLIFYRTDEKVKASLYSVFRIQNLDRNITYEVEP